MFDIRDIAAPGDLGLLLIRAVVASDLDKVIVCSILRSIDH
jgi:hypothetical protein